jgi:hypothetical protein
MRIQGTIKETYVIDPQLNIPSSLLPPLGEDESESNRKNLSLQARYGSVDVDISLVGDNNSGPEDRKRNYKKKRTTLTLASSHGSVTAKVVSTVLTLCVPCSFSAAHIICKSNGLPFNCQLRLWIRNRVPTSFFPGSHDTVQHSWIRRIISSSTRSYHNIQRNQLHTNVFCGGLLWLG